MTFCCFLFLPLTLERIRLFHTEPLTRFTMHKVIAAAIDSNILSASTSFIDQCCDNNAQYAQTYDETIYDVRAPPSKHLAVVCCMDARLDVFRMLGLKPGEAHVIRNGESLRHCSMRQ